ncbi:DUF3035 domain-containing protein [Caulobacter sp. NIBR2454]|uniref:DUF3035 domain-containing protein n=1 Tax=Caulobacter sp. NIBR2454 TaxID=3015996 RepID=UPI0022B60258|nr:DUF3035 domain-containing protein [Caulobacter sp. NIBR2454]
MSLTRVVAIAAIISAAGLAGCQSASKALGMSKVTPDEFRVVTKAPLVLPPDFSLRPPAPGQPRAAELAPDSAARAQLQGQAAAADRSQGENILVARAGGGSADPLIRFVVDDENGELAHKDKSFADRVMFWRKDQPAAGGDAATAGQSAPVVSAEAEEQRLKALTGGKAVVISRGSGGIKLPGL